MADIIISSSGENEDSLMAQNFGRAPFFAAFNEAGEFSVYNNPGLDAMGGAGIKAAQCVVSSGAKAVVTGKVGPRAEDVLKEAGIQVFVSKDTLTVKDALECCKGGKLQRLF